MKRSAQQGIALLEAILAVVILAIGLLGALGLQARAYSGMADASMRAEATLATEKLLGVMSNDLPNLDSYAVSEGGEPSDQLKAWHDETMTAIPGATIAVTVTPAAGSNRTEVVITISWQRRAGDPVHSHSVTSYVAQSS
jgi:type IV pilus assembly protein PilV